MHAKLDKPYHAKAPKDQHEVAPSYPQKDLLLRFSCISDFIYNRDTDSQAIWPRADSRAADLLDAQGDRCVDDHHV